MSAKNCKSKRRETLLYTIMRGFAWLVMTLFYPTKYEGLENIPTDRGYILCSNHRYLLDPVLLGRRIPQQLRFMAKAELFKGWFANWFLRTMGAFPVKRGSGDTHALDEAAQLIREGEVMAIFPEGHRSRDGRPLPFHAGISVIAARTGADILPVAISCKGKVGIWKPLTVRFGKLITHEALDLTEDSPRSRVREVTKKLGDTVVGLTDLYPDSWKQEKA